MTDFPVKRFSSATFAVCVLVMLLVFPSCSETRTGAVPVYSFPFTLENNRIVITATVNGVVGTYMFDTGAEGIMTSTSVDGLESIKCPYENYYLLGTIQSYDTYTLDTMSIGQTPFPVSTMVMHLQDKVLGFDGIIGGTIFKGYFLEVSFSDRVISLYADKPDGYQRSMSIFFDKQCKPHVHCNVDGINIPFLVDTGAPGNIIFPLPSSGLISRNKYEKVLFSDPDYQSYRVHVKYFDDGFRIYKNITGDVNPPGGASDGWILSRAGNLGLDYLKRFDIVLDYRGTGNALLYYRTRSLYKRFVRPRKGVWYLWGNANAQYNTYGLCGWTIENEKFYISSVTENGAAHKAGILPGTQVLRINGIDPHGFAVRKRNEILFISTKKLTLDCMIDGAEKTIEFGSR